MEMVKIKKCDMSVCAFNDNQMCHTMGINVGAHGECNTYKHGSLKGGFTGMQGGVGTCLNSDCRFNERFECTAADIDISSHNDGHADCKTFQTKNLIYGTD